MKLPIEPTDIRLEATLSKEQMNTLLTWYFKNFLGKTVQGVSYGIYNGDLGRATITCRDEAAPAKPPEMPTNKAVKTTPLVDID